MSFTQQNRHIAIKTPLGDDALLLRGFSGQEGISELFRIDLDLLSENDSIDFDAVIGKNATVRITLADGSPRYWNGYIRSIWQGNRDPFLTSYRAEMVPFFWVLTQISDCRIFQKKKAPDIIRAIFDEDGLADYALRLYGDFAEREYCVQYCETDFAFVSRLMEEEGIYYFFEHENGKHTLVLSNSPDGHKPCPNQPKARYELSAGGWQEDDVVLEWRSGQNLLSGSYSVQDFNFEAPSSSLAAYVNGRNKLRLYEYPGRYTQLSEGEQVARLRLQETEAQRVVASGASDCRAFTSGCRFDLTDHYRSDQNQAYVITRLRFMASEGADFRSGTGGGAREDARYRNEFECIPASVPFRPPRVTPRPTIDGVQTAVVVGPSGEEIYTDKHGRVKVQFHWDRRGRKNENSSCWIRVMQPWAGSTWGAVSLPRVGHEVVVTFVDGDPDRPLITGSVYNAEQVPPYSLPDHQTKTTMKTYSSKGGGGFNELRFEDKKGNEQIFIHGERNMDVRVKNDVLETVGGDTHLTVSGDSFEAIAGDAHLKIKGDWNAAVDGTVSLKSQMDVQTKVGMNYALDAGMEIHLKAGVNLVIESGVNLTLKVGGNFINLNPAGVFITGTMVMINSGGAAGSGAGASPQDPKPPKEADTAKPGKMIPPKPAPPVPPAKYSPAAVVMKEAAKNGAPFCDI